MTISLVRAAGVSLHPRSHGGASPPAATDGPAHFPVAGPVGTREERSVPPAPSVFPPRVEPELVAGSGAAAVSGAAPWTRPGGGPVASTKGAWPYSDPVTCPPRHSPFLLQGAATTVSTRGPAAAPAETTIGVDMDEGPVVAHTTTGPAHTRCWVDGWAPGTARCRWHDLIPGWA